ncbi:hypothetical protein E0H51_03525 [Rhizobium leguminosarum bv. viciae]|nr:hypothetical protein CHY08_31265 [Rhizobium leguminosarum bv. viciae]NKN03140.1 hypothetical protein [Rhizobium leguminosarum bv. viciae]TBY80367.1 hypothetical protein E0H51_03525 [Rhizobium leguminosarum bv. viciae]
MGTKSGVGSDFGLNFPRAETIVGVVRKSKLWRLHVFSSAWTTLLHIGSTSFFPSIDSDFRADA